MSGKGSRPRPFTVSQAVFDNNWDTIFNKKELVTELAEYELNKSTGEVQRVDKGDGNDRKR